MKGSQRPPHRIPRPPHEPHKLHGHDHVGSESREKRVGHAATHPSCSSSTKSGPTQQTEAAHGTEVCLPGEAGDVGAGNVAGADWMIVEPQDRRTLLQPVKKVMRRTLGMTLEVMARPAPRHRQTPRLERSQPLT